VLHDVIHLEHALKAQALGRRRDHRGRVGRGGPRGHDQPLRALPLPPREALGAGGGGGLHRDGPPARGLPRARRRARVHGDALHRLHRVRRGGGLQARGDQRRPRGHRVHRHGERGARQLPARHGAGLRAGRPRGGAGRGAAGRREEVEGHLERGAGDRPRQGREAHRRDRGGHRARVRRRRRARSRRWSPERRGGGDAARGVRSGAALWYAPGPRHDAHPCPLDRRARRRAQRRHLRPALVLQRPPAPALRRAAHAAAAARRGGGGRLGRPRRPLRAVAAQHRGVVGRAAGAARAPSGRALPRGRRQAVEAAWVVAPDGRVAQSRVVVTPPDEPLRACLTEAMAHAQVFGPSPDGRVHHGALRPLPPRPPRAPSPRRTSPRPSRATPTTPAPARASSDRASARRA
jgi:hypothetical protein